MAGLFDYAKSKAGLLADAIKRNATNLWGEVQTAPQQVAQMFDPNWQKQMAQALQTPGMRAKIQEDMRQAALDWGNPIAGVGKIVYHGSPHKFSKFDMSKIGTGEGAQAYGHGLYFAEAPAVAQSYADVLGDSKLLVNGKPFEAVGNTTQATAVRAIAAQGYDESVKAAKQMLDEGADPNWVKNYMHDLNKLKGQDIRYETTGNLYKVDIPDEIIPRMLDWDKPLSEQPYASKMVKDFADLNGIENYIPSGSISPVLVGKGISGDTTGKQLYDYFASHALDINGVASRQNAASDMQAFGIPGIRYLDGMSRGTGGTSNFVLFDDQLPRILETNGQPTGLTPWTPEEYAAYLAQALRK